MELKEKINHGDNYPPPELDLNYYRQSYPELNIFPDDVLIEHAKKFAVEEGRSTCIYDRREYLQALLQNTIDENGLRALEISPWDNPFLRGENVKYFGVEDSETLRKLAVETGRNPAKVPEKIHFVSPTADLGAVNEKFAIIFSSHVVEHCPDLVTHFNSVAKLLDTGGLYILAVPDKRYCFDHYHAESTLSEVIEAFAVKRKIPRFADVMNQGYTCTHNNAVLHWLGNHGERYGYRNTPLAFDQKVEVMGEYFQDDGQGASLQKLARLVDKYNEALLAEKYISTHNWRFTPESFGYIVDMLNQLNMINLSRYRLCHTVWGRNEFIAMLEKI